MLSSPDQSNIQSDDTNEDDEEINIDEITFANLKRSKSDNIFTPLHKRTTYASVPQFNRHSSIMMRENNRNNPPKAYQKYLLWIENSSFMKEFESVFQEANSITSLRAFVSIYSSILLWVGTWDSFDRLMAHAPRIDITHNITIHTIKYYVSSPIYLVIGTLVMLFIGTFYENAGYGGTWRHPSFYQKWLKIKVAVAHFGQFLFYYGAFLAIYQLQDVYHILLNDDNDLFYDIFVYTIGFIILCITDAFWCLSGVTPPWYKIKKITPDDGKWKHLYFTCLSFLVIIGFSIAWSCTTDFLENYSKGNVWRELFYICMGLLLFVSTGSFVANSLIWVDFDDDDDAYGVVDDAQMARSLLNNSDNNGGGSSVQHVADIDFNSPKNTKGWKWFVWIAFYLRAWISFEAQILHTTGSWTLFNEYVWESSYPRNAVYIIVGICGLSWSKALFMKACITPFNIPAQPDGLMRTMTMPNYRLHRAQILNFLDALVYKLANAIGRNDIYENNKKMNGNSQNINMQIWIQTVSDLIEKAQNREVNLNSLNRITSQMCILY